MPTSQELRAKMADLQKQIDEAEEAERKAAMAGSAKRATSLLALMKAAHKEIEALFPGTFEGGAWDDLKPQAWPRDTKFKRIADLSETEVHEARERGRNAVADLK